MVHITQIAYEFILNHGIAQLPIRADDVMALVKKLGYEIYSYEEAATFIKLKQLEEMEERAAFTYFGNHTRVVLYRDGLPAEEKTFTLLHEVGHIVLGHVKCGTIGSTDEWEYTNRQEEEANHFAYCVMTVPCVLKKCRVLEPASIQRVTLIGKTRAERVAGQLIDYAAGPLDEKVLLQFKGYIQNYKGKRKYWVPITVCLLAALIALTITLTNKGGPPPLDSSNASPGASESASSTPISQGSSRYGPTSGTVTAGKTRQTSPPATSGGKTAAQRTTTAQAPPATTPPPITQPPATSATKPKLTDDIRRQITTEVQNIYQPQYDKLKATHEDYITEQQDKLIDIDTQYEIDRLLIQQSGGGAGYQQAKLADLEREKNRKTKEIQAEMEKEKEEYEKSISALDEDVAAVVNQRLAEYEQ